MSVSIKFTNIYVKNYILSPVIDYRQDQTAMFLQKSTTIIVLYAQIPDVYEFPSF